MNYQLTDNIAHITMDDGKVNVVGHKYLDQINAHLDQAEADAAGAVILRGREGVFSAGFDLAEFKSNMESGMTMVRRGFELALRLYGFPSPVVAACTGHGIAMGAFILLAADNRIGIHGKFKFSLPETAINMDLPKSMIDLATDRLSPLHLTRAALQSEVYSPEQAVEAGFLDEVVAPEYLDSRALEVAQQLAGLPANYYARNKLAIRRHVLKAMTDNLPNPT